MGLLTGTLESARKFYNYLGLLAFGSSGSAVDYRRVVADVRKLKTELEWMRNSLHRIVELNGVDASSIRRETEERVDREYQFSQRFLELAGASARIRELEQALAQKEKISSEYEERIRQLSQEFMAYKLDYSKLEGLTSHLKAENKSLKRKTEVLQREILRRVSLSRTREHSSLCKTLESYCQPANSNGVIIVLDHTGAVAYLSRRAEELFGEIKGKNYREIIGGSDEQIRFVEQHFNPSDESKHEEGWLYINLRGKNGKVRRRAAKAEINHEYVSESVDGKDVLLRHSTVVLLKDIGWKSVLPRILAGEKCLQDIAGDIKEKERVAENVKQVIVNVTDEINARLKSRGVNTGS